MSMQLVPLPAPATASAIPDGWALCDGGTHDGHATPDLRNRFVVGAGDHYSVSDTGGADEVKLTIDQMPSHNHKYTQGHFESFFGHGAYSDMWVHYDSGNNYTTKTGGDQPHENRPPYYALCYIMRVK